MAKQDKKWTPPENLTPMVLTENGLVEKDSVMNDVKKPEAWTPPENLEPYTFETTEYVDNEEAIRNYSKKWNDRITKDVPKKVDTALEAMEKERLEALPPEERKIEEDRISNRPKPLTDEQGMERELKMLSYQIAKKETEMNNLSREFESEYYDPEIHGVGNAMEEYEMPESEMPEGGIIPLETEVVENVRKRRRELKKEINELKQERLNIVGNSEEHGYINRFIKQKEDELDSYDLRKMKTFADRAKAAAIGSLLGPAGLVAGFLKGGKVERDLIKEMYNETNSELSELKTRRAQILNEIIKPDEKQVKEIRSMLGSVTGEPGQDLTAELKYGKNKVAYAERTAIQEMYANINDIKLAERKRDLDTRGMLDVDVMQQKEFPEMIQDPEKMQDARKIFEKLRKMPEFQKGNLQTQKALIDRHVGKYLKETIEDPVERNKAHMNMMPYMLRNYIFNEENDITLSGVQLYTENHSETLNDRKADIENTLKKLITKGEKVNYTNDPLKLITGDKNVEHTFKDENDAALYKKLINERILINNSLDFNDKILGMNPGSSLAAQLRAGISSPSAKDLLTLGINEMAVSLQIKGITDKIENGEQPTWTESKILESFALLNMANGTKEMSTDVFGVPVSVYRIGAGMTEMLPYVASFIFTSGAFTAGKAGTKKLVTQPLKKLIGKKAVQSINLGTTINFGKKSLKTTQKILGTTKTSMSLGSAAVKGVEFLGGSAAQAFANQQMYQKSLAEAQTGNVSLNFGSDQDDLLIKVDANTTTKKDARIEAGVQVFAEIFTERLGAHLMKGVGTTKRAAKAAVGLDPAKKLIPAKKYMLGKLKHIKEMNYPGKGWDVFLKKQAGWDGIFEEYLEELANYTMVKVVTGEGAGSTKEFIGQQIETLGTVATFGTAMNITRFSQNYNRYVLPDRVIYKTIDENGKEKSVFLPKDINDQIDNIFEKGSTEYFGEQIQSVIDKNRKNLDKNQIKFILEMVGQKSLKRMMQDFLPEELKQEDRTSPEGETTDTKLSREANEKSEFLKAFDQVREQVSPEHKALMDKYNKPTAPPIEQETKADKQEQKPVTEKTDVQFEQELPETQLNEEEQKEADQANDRIRTAYPDLYEYNLLEQENGILIEPTLNDLKQKRNELILEVDSMPRDDSGAFVDLDENTNFKIDQLNTLDQYIKSKELAESKSRFQSLPSSQKWDVLHKELQSGKEKTGTASFKTVQAMTVVLDNGHTVLAYYRTENEKPNEKTALANKAMTSNTEKVSLKLIPKSEWNPEGKWKNKITGFEYGDKIVVVNSKGQHIASVEETDWEKEKELKRKKAEISNRLDDKLNKINNAFEDYFTNQAVSNNDGKKANFNTLLDVLIDAAIEIANLIGIEAKIIIEELRKKINESNNSPDKIKKMSDFLDQHKDQIIQGVEDHYDSIEDKVNQMSDNPIKIVNGYQEEVSEGVAPEETPKEEEAEPAQQKTINIDFSSNENAGLSNLAERSFKDEGINDIGTIYLDNTGTPIIWKTVEGAFQAEKLIYAGAEYWADDSILSDKGMALVRELSKASGTEAKKIGSKIKGLDKAEWDKYSERVMSNLIYVSFASNTKAKKQLLDTGDALLTQVQDKKKWGKIFPKILSDVRETLLQERTVFRNQEDQNATESELHEKRGANGVSREEVDAQGQTANQKTDNILRSFAPLWKKAEELSQVKKESIVTEFYKMARNDRYNKVSDQDSYIAFLESFRNESAAHNAIIEVLKEQTYDDMRSGFNFFRNVRKTKHVATILRNESVSLPILNTGPNYEELVEAFTNKANNFSINIGGEIYTGIYGIILKIQEAFNQAADEIQRQWNQLTPEERVERVKKQHEIDLDTLEIITGIEKDTWRFYFNKQNKETVAYGVKKQYETDLDILEIITGIEKDTWRSYFKQEIDFDIVEKITGIEKDTLISSFNRENKKTVAYNDRNKKTKITFDTYDELLEHDVYRAGSEGKFYPRVQSDLMFSLYNRMRQTSNMSEQERLDAFINFFKRGNQSRNVLSNLYKLSQSITTSDDLAVSLLDVKYDRKSSFIQSSHLQRTAENLRKLSVESPLVDYYRLTDQVGEVVLIAGVQDYDRSPEKTGTESSKMSYDDIMFSLTQHFLVGDEYLQHLGQFGDKDHIATISVQKQFPQTSDYEKMKSKFSDYDQAVNELLYQVLLPNRAYYVNEKDNKITGPAADYPGKTQMEKLENMAKHFVYNYGFWIEEINKVFHGELSRYDQNKGETQQLIQLMKRASTTTTSGYRPDQNVKGGVKSKYRVLVLNDTAFRGIKDENGKDLSREIFDGNALFSHEELQRIGVSMGDVFLKPDKYDTLTSIKAAHSSVNHETGWRGLMKTNNVDIDVMEKMYAASDINIYTKLKKLMKRLNVDVITFTSGNKQLEYDVPVFNLYNEKSNITIDLSTIPSEAVFERSYDDFYIQQDLRHSIIPSERAMPSQALTNSFSLPSGNTIAFMFNQIRESKYKDFMNEFPKNTDEQVRLKILRGTLKPEVNDDITALLDASVGANEPGTRRIMLTMISSAVSKALLDIPTNRVTTQEVPDSMGILNSRKDSKTAKGKSLLPDIITGAKGVRAHYYRFQGNSDAAIRYVKKERKENRFAYQDLYDDQGQLKVWEIIDRNGVIPGDYVVSIRVPIHGHPAITVGRLAKNTQDGNFTMLDMESQRNSGSDYDGDARYNSFLFKNENGNVIMDSSNKGLANRAMFLMIRDYESSDMTEQLTFPINTNAYDDIVNRQRKNIKEYGQSDYRAYLQSWVRAQVGNDLKGKLTDMNTIFTLATKYKIELRNINLPWTDIVMTSINSDEYGSIKRHIGDFQNMAFDNIKDPKLEDIGLNEVTVNMYMVPIMANPELDSKNFKDKKDPQAAHYKAIYDAINKQSDYFTSPLLREFVRQVRKKNGGIYDSKIGLVFNSLKKSSERANSKWTPEDVKDLKDYYYLAREIYDIRTVYRLTQQMPLSITDLIVGNKLMDKLNKNNYKLFDNKRLFNKEGEFKQELLYAKESLGISQEVIFYDAAELNQVGKKVLFNIHRLIENRHIQKYNLQKVGKVDLELTKQEIETYSYHLNNILAVKAYNKDRTFDQVREELVSLLRKTKQGNSDNKFLEKIFIYDNKYGQTIEIEKEYRNRPISDINMERIHDDFTILNPKLKELLVTYAFHRFGTSMARSNGSFYALVSNEHKATVEEKILKEKKRMENGEYTPEEVASIVKHTLQASSVPRFAEFWEEKQKHALQNYDINQPISAEQVSFFNNGNAFDPDGFINNMLREDGIGEMLASKDQALTDFIINHLKKNYPGVQIFTNRESFYEFARKNGANMYNVTPTAIGHAFKNAVFIDPKKAVQSTSIHEFGHIYWDALPNNSKAKQKLISLYQSHRKFKGLRTDQIEEQIIRDIAKAGYTTARIEFKGYFLERFLEILRDFFREVKRLVGIDSKKDLVRDLSKEIWSNRANIDVRSIPAGVAIRNMEQTIDENTSENEDMGSNAAGKHYYPVTKIFPSFEQNSFDIENASRIQIQKQIADHKVESKEDLKKIELDKIIEDTKDNWNIRTERGTTIHAVAEYIFGGKERNERDINPDFINTDSLERLKSSLQSLKSDIEKKFPGITFSTEESILSDKYETRGVIDLKGTLPDGKVILFDFKSTDYAYVKEDGSINPKYAKKYGLMNHPFSDIARSSRQLKDKIQLNIYSQMSEDNGEEVSASYIIPIVTQIISGKIMRANVANEVGTDSDLFEGERSSNAFDNMVEVPWRKIDKIKIIDILKTSAENRKDISNDMEEYRANLEKTEIYSGMIEHAVRAENHFRGIKPNLAELSYRDLEWTFKKGFSMVSAALMEKGFSLNNMIGEDALSMEQLFFAAMDSDITLESFKDLDTFFPEQEVELGFKKEISDKWKGNYFYKHQVDGEQLYFKEAGHESIMPGDEVIEFYYPKIGTKEKEVSYRYKVTAVNKKFGYLLVENVNTGQPKRIESPAAKEGTLLIVDKSSVKTETSYIENKRIDPRYENKRQFELQRHRKRLSDKDLPEDELDTYRKSITQVELLFNAYNTPDKMREFLNNKDAVSKFYEKIRPLQDKHSLPLRILLAETLMLHELSEGIRRENQYELRYLKPITLNAYFLATGNQMSSVMSFSSGGVIQSMEPARMKNAKHVQLHLVTNGVEYKARETQMQQEAFRIKYEELIKDVNHDNIVSEFSGRNYYKRPNSLGLTKAESALLSLIYEYHYKYNSEYNTHNVTEENPYPAKIRRASIYWTSVEAQKEHGTKWGSVIHEILAPKEYDHIKLNLVEKDKDGNIREIPGRKVTLRDIKKEFALQMGSEYDKIKWLGKPLQQYISRSTFLERSFIGSNALLRYYNDQAKREYDSNRKDNSIEARLRKASIPVIGAGQAIVETKKRHLAEEQTIESMIFAYNMKSAIGPIDYMRYVFGGETDVNKWLAKYTDYILHKQKPSDSLGFLDSRGMNEVTDVLLRLNSLNKIAWSIPVQLNNFAIGVGMNLSREPGAFLTGLNRVADLPKVYNMLKKYKFLSAANEALLDAVQKINTVSRLTGEERVSKVKWLVENGYKPMEWVETAIQSTLVAGLLTREELDNHDIQGNPINGELLPIYRIQAVHDRVRRIHGDYTPLFAAPYWLENQGSLMMQFRKWIPGMVEAEFAGYHINRNFELTSGIAGIINLMGKMFKYNVLKDGKAKQLKYEAVLEKHRNNKEGDMGPISQEFISSTEEYFNHLVLENAAGRITWKESATKADRRNLRSLILQGAFYIGLVGLQALFQKNDDDWDKTDPRLRAISQWLNRYQNDLFAPIAYDAQKSVFDMPLPVVDMVLNLGQFWVQLFQLTGGLIFDSEYRWENKQGREAIKQATGKQYVFPITADLSEKGRYGQDSRYARAGTPKIFVTALKLVPAGSMMRSINMHRLRILNNQKVFDIEKSMGEVKNSEEKEFIEYWREEYGSTLIKKKDIDRLGGQYDLLIKTQESDLFKKGITEAYKEQGLLTDKEADAIDQLEIASVLELESNFNKDVQDVEKAIKMATILAAYKSDPASLTEDEKLFVQYLEMLSEAERINTKERLRYMPSWKKKNMAKRGLYNMDVEALLLEESQVYDNRKIFRSSKKEDKEE